MGKPEIIVKTEKIFKYLLRKKASVFCGKKNIDIYIYQGNKDGYSLKKKLDKNYQLKSMILKDVINQLLTKKDTRFSFSDNRNRLNQCGLCYEGKRMRDILK